MKIAEEIVRIFSGGGVGRRRIWNWPPMVGKGEEEEEVGGKDEVFCLLNVFIILNINNFFIKW